MIGAGFGRTGTASLKTALEILLKSPCYHMSELTNQDSVPQRSYIKNTVRKKNSWPSTDSVPTLREEYLLTDLTLQTYRHSEAWLHVARSRGDVSAIDLKALFKDCQSTVDFPSCIYYQSLLTLYPSAKIILTSREFNAWHASAKKTIHKPQTDLKTWIIRALTLGRERLHFALMNEAVWYNPRLFAGRFLEPAFTQGVFEEWQIECIKSVPAEQLLVYDVKQGWEPLCEFLGVEVPDVDFPQWNKAETFEEGMTKRTDRTFRGLLWNWSGVLCAVGILGIAGVVAGREARGVRNMLR